MRNIISVSFNKQDAIEEIRKETKDLKRVHVVSIERCERNYDNGVYHNNYKDIIDLVERAERGVEMVVVFDDFAGILGDKGLHNAVSKLLSSPNVKSYVNLTSDYGAMEAYKMIDREMRPTRVEIRYFHGGEYVTMHL